MCMLWLRDNLIYVGSQHKSDYWGSLIYLPHLVCFPGHKDIVKILVAHKASTCVPDSTGKLLTCQAYDGIQFELEQMRSAHMEA